MTKQIDTSWWTLRLIYGLVPIVAGADKFTNLLTDWKQYASPILGNLPIPLATLMMIIGVIEIVAGCLVLSRHTRFGAYVVGAWLVGIALNIVTTGKYFDVAVRDLVMAAGAFTLAMLSEVRVRETTRSAATSRAAVLSA